MKSWADNAGCAVAIAELQRQLPHLCALVGQGRNSIDSEAQAAGIAAGGLGVWGAAFEELCTLTTAISDAAPLSTRRMVAAATRSVPSASHLAQLSVAPDTMRRYSHSVQLLLQFIWRCARSRAADSIVGSSAVERAGKLVDMLDVQRATVAQLRAVLRACFDDRWHTTSLIMWFCRCMSVNAVTGVLVPASFLHGHVLGILHILRTFTVAYTTCVCLALDGGPAFQGGGVGSSELASAAERFGPPTAVLIELRACAGPARTDSSAAVSCIAGSLGLTGHDDIDVAARTARAGAPVFVELCDLAALLGAETHRQSAAPAPVGADGILIENQVLYYELMPARAAYLLQLLQQALTDAACGLPLPGTARFVDCARGMIDPPGVVADGVDQRRMGDLLGEHLAAQWRSSGGETPERLSSWARDHGDRVCGLLAELLQFCCLGVARATEMCTALLTGAGSGRSDVCSSLYCCGGQVYFLLQSNKSTATQRSGGVDRPVPAAIARCLALYVGFLRPFHEYCIAAGLLGLDARRIRYICACSPQSRTPQDSMDLAACRTVKGCLFLRGDGALPADCLRRLVSTSASHVATIIFRRRHPDTPDATVTVTLRMFRQLAAHWGLIVYDRCDHQASELLQTAVTWAEASRRPYMAATVAALREMMDLGFGHSVQTGVQQYGSLAGMPPCYPATGAGNALLSSATIYQSGLGLATAPAMAVDTVQVTGAAGAAAAASAAADTSGGTATPAHRRSHHKRQRVLNTTPAATGAAQSAAAPVSACPTGQAQEMRPALTRMAVGDLSTLLTDRMQIITGDDSARFRPHQLEAIIESIQGRDVLVVCETGGGKSLVYALATTVGPCSGTAVVVVPTTSLQQDAVRRLRACGFGAEELLSTNAATVCFAGQQFLLTTPETLAVGSVQAVVLQSMRTRFIRLLVIDEVHCMLTDARFRPDYLSLSTLTASVRVLALTATMPPSYVQRLETALGLHNQPGRSLVVFRSSVWRPNLAFAVQQMENQRAMVNEAIELAVDAFAVGERCIVYCSEIARVNEVGGAIQQRVPHERVFVYYGHGLAEEVRTETADALVSGQGRLFVTTSALGVGMHAPDIERLIVLGSYNLFEMLQYAGRAGRDGRLARVVILLCDSVMERIRSTAEQNGGSELGMYNEMSALLSTAVNTALPAHDRCLRRLVCAAFDGPSCTADQPSCREAKVTDHRVACCSACEGSVAAQSSELARRADERSAQMPGTAWTSEQVVRELTDSGYLVLEQLCADACVMCAVVGGVSGWQFREGAAAAKPPPAACPAWRSHGLARCPFKARGCRLCGGSECASSACRFTALPDVRGRYICFRCGRWSNVHTASQCGTFPFAPRIAHAVLRHDGLRAALSHTRLLPASAEDEAVLWLRLQTPVDRLGTACDQRRVHALFVAWFHHGEPVHDESAQRAADRQPVA